MPPPGLIYKTNNGLWRVDSDGKSAQLSKQFFDYISPEGTSAIDLKGSPFLEEMWLTDLVTGQQHNLTEKLGRSITCAVWWPERFGSILFGSWPLQDGGRNSGFLSIIQADRSGYEILDEEKRLKACLPRLRTLEPSPILRVQRE